MKVMIIVGVILVLYNQNKIGCRLFPLSRFFDLINSYKYDTTLYLTRIYDLMLGIPQLE